MNASMTIPSSSSMPQSSSRPWEDNITYGSTFAPDGFETEVSKNNQSKTDSQTIINEQITSNVQLALQRSGTINFQTVSTEEISVSKKISQDNIVTPSLTLPKSDATNSTPAKPISSDPSSDNQFWANLEKNLKAVASNTDFISSAVKTGSDASKDVIKEISSMVTNDILGMHLEKPTTKEDEEKKRKLHEFFARHAESRKTTISQEQQKVMAVIQQSEDVRFEVAGNSEEELAQGAGHQKNYKVEKTPYLRSFLFFKKMANKKDQESNKETSFTSNSKQGVGVDGKLRQDLANEGGILSTTGGVGAG